FPLVTIALKTKKLGKFAVEMSQGIGKGNHEHGVEPAVVALPDGRRFPRAAAVHHHNSSILKSRVRIGADGMRKVMINKPHSRFCRPELLREFLRSAFLVPHAQEV